MSTKQEMKIAIDFAEWLDSVNALRINNLSTNREEDLGKWWVCLETPIRNKANYFTTEELYRFWLQSNAGG